MTKIKRSNSISDWDWLRRPLEVGGLPAYAEYKYRLSPSIEKNFKDSFEEKLYFVSWLYEKVVTSEDPQIVPDWLIDSLEQEVFKGKFGDEEVLDGVTYTHFHHFIYLSSALCRDRWDVYSNEGDRKDFLIWFYALYRRGVGFNSRLRQHFDKIYRLDNSNQELLPMLFKELWKSDPSPKKVDQLQSSKASELKFYETCLMHLLDLGGFFLHESELTYLKTEIGVVEEGELAGFPLTNLTKIYNSDLINAKKVDFKNVDVEKIVFGFGRSELLSDKQKHFLIQNFHNPKSSLLDCLIQYDEGPDGYEGITHQEFKQRLLESDFSILSLSSDTKGILKRIFNGKESTLNDFDLKFEMENSPGVNLIGYPFGCLGLGEDIRTSSNSFKAYNYEISVFDLDEENGDFPHLSKSLQYDINLFNAPPIIGPIIFEKYGVDFFLNKYNIGYCPWELDRWHQDYSFCFKFFQEIWAPSKFLFECYTKSSDLPVFHMPLPVELPSFTRRERAFFEIPADKFVFFYMFDFNSKISRKNPFAALRAFKLAFPNNHNVCLVIKVLHPSNESAEFMNFMEEVSGDERILLITDLLSREDVLALFACCDSFISLHRSEGFGRCIAEAMLLRKPVISTNYSGNLDFCTDETAFLVDYDLIDVKKGEYPYSEGLKWADPKVGDAADKMKTVYQGSEEVKIKLENAYSLVLNEFDVKSAGQRFINRINSIRKAGI